MARPTDTSRAFAAAINARDSETALACWLPNAVMVSGDGSTARGHEALRSRIEQLVASEITLAISVDDEVETDDTAIARTQMTMNTPSHGPLRFHGTVVYLRQDAGWQIAIDQVQPAN